MSGMVEGISIWVRGPGGSAALKVLSSFPWPIDGGRAGDKSGLGARMLGINAGRLA